MKTTSMGKALFFTFVMGICTTIAQAEEKADAAVTAAKAWLALVDAKEYKKSWREAAPYFKENVKEERWEEMIAGVRNPLGKTESRELLTAEYKTSLPGAPDGEYVVIQFKTKFTGKRDSVETITPMKTNGVWRVSGYFIK
jgi:hypothetical protein